MRARAPLHGFKAGHLGPRCMNCMRAARALAGVATGQSMRGWDAAECPFGFLCGQPGVWR